MTPVFWSAEITDGYDYAEKLLSNSSSISALSPIFVLLIYNAFDAELFSAKVE